MKSIIRLIGKALSKPIINKMLKEDINIVFPGKIDQKNTSIHQITINDWSFFWDILVGYDLGFAESYIQGKWDHQNLTNLFKFFSDKTSKNKRPSIGNFAPKKIYARFIQKIKSTNTISQSKKNISDHYDLSNEFFMAFLDPTMTYSCGIFKNNDTLEDAQHNKLNSLIQASKVKNNQQVLEIGCGWGSLTKKIAYDHNTEITSITLSKQQYQYAKKLFDNTSFSSNINLKLTDYRLIEGKFDHIFSVEMLEAVGHKGTQDFFQKCASLLNHDGTLQIQVITIPHERYNAYKNNCDFIQRYIFPGGLLLSLEHIRDAAKSAGFQIYKEYSIGHHYATTLNHWKNNFLNNYEKINKLGFPETDIRRFLYYFSYCEGAFLSGVIDDYQISLRKI